MQHNDYMLRCLELAKLGLGNASPNPMVGAVIVHEQDIIGEGYHKQYGSHHAEVNAVNSVSAADRARLPSSRMYISLEPCSFFGNTPPCADLLLKERIPHVIVANLDPHPKVAGSSLIKLKDNKVRVDFGFLHKEAQYLNRRFFTWHLKKRPYIILKWAQTADHYIAPSNESQKWITGPGAKQLVHKWRSEEDAILIGVNTANIDDPHLGLRHWQGKPPHRFVIDLHQRIETRLQLLDGSIPTTIFYSGLRKAVDKPNLHYQAIDPSENILHQLMQHTHQMKIQSLIVEGGATTLHTFIEANLWDEARVLTGEMTFGNGIAAPMLRRAKLCAEERIGKDRLQLFQNQSTHS